MVAYSQQTRTGSGGRFAPNVNINYSSAVRMPSQPMPDLPKAESNFNIDLSGLQRANQRAAELDRIAKKEEEKAAAEARIQSLKAGLSKELSKIQAGRDQNVYDSATALKRGREALDHYIELGLDPDEGYPIFENGLDVSVRGIHSDRRIAIQNAINNQDATTIAAVRQNVPSYSNKSDEEILQFANEANKARADLEVAVRTGQGIEAAGKKVADIQAVTTAVNMIGDGTATSETAGVNISQSVLQSLVSVGVPNDQALYMTQNSTKGAKEWFDTLQKMTDAERENAKAKLEHMKVSRQIAFLSNPNISEETKLKTIYNFYGDEDDKIFAPQIVELDVVENTGSDSATGRTTSSPRTVKMVVDALGNKVACTDESCDMALKELENISRQQSFAKGSLGYPILKKDMNQVMVHPSASVQGKELSTISEGDLNTTAENMKGVAGLLTSSSNLTSVKNNEDKKTEQSIRRYSDIAKGVGHYTKTPGVKNVVDSSSQYFRALKGNETMLENTRVNDEGFLVATEDVKGFVGTMQQYMTGHKYRNNLYNINKRVSMLPKEIRKPVLTAALSSYDIAIKDYDPEVDGVMTDQPTEGETFAQNVFETGKAAWEVAQEKYLEPLKKGFDNLEEAIEKEFIEPADKNLSSGVYKERIKEALEDAKHYIANMIQNYKAQKALEVEEGVGGLEHIVNRGKAAEDFLNYIRDTSEKLNEITPENMPSAINSIVQTEPVVPATGDPLDLNTYPLQKNEDGSVSNIKTEIVGREVDGKEVEFIVPTMGDTSKHFGGYATVEDAEAADKELHEKLDIKIAAEGVNKHKQFVDDFIDGAEEAIKDVAGKYSDEMATVLEPAVSTVEGFKAGFKAGETVFKDDEKAYSIFVQAVNEAGKKRFGLIRQILLSMPFSAGYVAGQLKELVPFVIHLAATQGIELDRPEAERIAKVSQELYKDMYRKSVVDNSKTAKRKRYEEFETKYKKGTPYKRAYYGVKETDELNQALMEPFLND